MRYDAPSVSRIEAGWKVEVLHEGKSVSRLWVVDRRMRVGAAVLTVGGIAGVGTDPEHRRRGLALRVLRRSLRLLRDEGYDASFLFGIADYYDRAGFATCFPEHGFAFDTRQAETVRSSLRTRKMRPADLPAIRTLYQRQNRLRTGSVVRSRGWPGFPMGSGWGVAGRVHVVCAPGAVNRILGYVLYDDINDRCRVAEVGGAGDDVNGAIVRFLGRRAVQLRKEWVTASVPGDHPFAIFCRSLGYRDETRYPRNGGPMGRAIDLTRFLTALAPELTSRWPDDAPQQLSMSAGDESVSLTRRRGVVSVRSGASGRRLKVADSALLMQLAMGYRDADDALGAGTLVGSGVQRELARALFPLRVAHMWWPDRF